MKKSELVKLVEEVVKIKLNKGFKKGINEISASRATFEAAVKAIENLIGDAPTAEDAATDFVSIFTHLDSGTGRDKENDD